MSGGNINAAKCAYYLRSVGVEVGDAMEADWLQTERDTRERRRAANRELKKSCGHFRTHACTVHVVDGASSVQTVCDDCGRIVRIRPLTPTPPRSRKRIPA